MTVSNGVSEILERAHINLDEFPISEPHLRREIRDLIWGAKADEDDTSDVFSSNMDDLPQYLGSQDWPEYTIIFPLNIQYRDVDRPDEYGILNESIMALSSDEWENFSEEAYDAEQRAADESDAIGAYNKIERLLSDSPNKLDRSDQTHWMFETEGIDARYAIDECEDILTYLMGSINFALPRGQIEGGQFNSSTWNTRWMKIRDPFIYLVFKNGDYYDHFYSTDPSPRKPITLSAHKARYYENNINDIPELNKDLNSLEEKIVSGLYSFQDAVTSSDTEDIFLNHWRGIENLTLSSRNHSTGDIAERARTVAMTESGVRESEVVEKRNKLVHESERTEITTEDTNILKLMMEGLLLKYVEKRNEWDRTDLEFFFDNGNRSDNSLEQIADTRRRELELINELRA